MRCKHCGEPLRIKKKMIDGEYKTIAFCDHCRKKWTLENNNNPAKAAPASSRPQSKGKSPSSYTKRGNGVSQNQRSGFTYPNDLDSDNLSEDLTAASDKDYLSDEYDLPPRRRTQNVRNNGTQRKNSSSNRGRRNVLEDLIWNIRYGNIDIKVLGIFFAAAVLCIVVVVGFCVAIHKRSTKDLIDASDTPPTATESTTAPSGDSSEEASSEASSEGASNTPVTEDFTAVDQYLTQQGVVSGEATSIDASAVGAVAGQEYASSGIIIYQFDPSSESYTQIAATGTVTGGLLGGLNNGYVLVLTGNEMNNDVVKAFYGYTAVQ